MRERTVNVLVWAAAQLNVAASKLLSKAIQISLEEPKTPVSKDLLKDPYAQAPAQVDAEPPPVPKAVNLVEDPVVFRDSEGNPIPGDRNAPLPDPQIFRHMFERKYGKDGHCPIALGGQKRLLDCASTFELLRQINKSEDAQEVHKAMYGALLAVIMQAHGETPNKVSLN